MKTQSSLEVPKQVRSASFDEIKLEAQRTAQYIHQSSTDSQTGLLTVPNVVPPQQRSRSFDSAGIEPSDANASFLDVPRRFARRKSSAKSPVCIHCLYVEDQRKRGSTAGFYFDAQEFKTLTYYESSSSSSSESETETDETKDENNWKEEDLEDNNNDEDEEDSDVDKYFNQQILPLPLPPSPCITFTLSPTNCDYPAFPLPDIVPGTPPALPSTPPVFPPPSTPTTIIELPTNDFDEIEIPGPRTRRRSISRQEAIFMEPSGASLDIVTNNVTNSEPETKDDDNENNSSVNNNNVTSTISTSTNRTKEMSSLKPDDPFVRDIFLTVPDLKRDRAASVDSCFSKVSSAAKTEEVQPPEGELNLLSVPNTGAVRSRSVDIVLPTEQQARYKALALAGPASNLFKQG
jgi:diacylglycerol kinase (ATP)